MKCGAKTRNGTPCQKPAMTNGRCRLHGGLTPAGPASPNYKTGKYSKYLPEALRARYEDFVNDPEITKITGEIGLLDTRIAQLSDQVESDVAARTWRELQRLWSRFMFAVQSGDADKQVELLSQVDDFIKQRIEQNSVWEDIERLTLSRTKLAEAEQKRLVQNNQMLSVEQALTLVGALVASIKDVVYLYADPTTARHIIVGTSQAYAKLIGGPSSSDDVDSRTIDG